MSKSIENKLELIEYPNQMEILKLIGKNIHMKSFEILDTIEGKVKIINLYHKVLKRDKTVKGKVTTNTVNYEYIVRINHHYQRKTRDFYINLTFTYEDIDNVYITEYKVKEVNSYKEDFDFVKDNSHIIYHLNMVKNERKYLRKYFYPSNNFYWKETQNIERTRLYYVINVENKYYLLGFRKDKKKFMFYPNHSGILHEDRVENFFEYLDQKHSTKNIEYFIQSNFERNPSYLGSIIEFYPENLTNILDNFILLNKNRLK